MRIGIGYDSHRLGVGGPLRLGGIDIPADIHAIGHSDADVLLHALTDALLGAIAAPDIGRLFPDRDPANKDRDSVDFLNEAMQRVAADGWTLSNMDSVILAQAPKLAPHIDAMRSRLSEVTNWQPSQIGIKAKTGEQVGEIGTGQAIAARCVVLLERSKA